MGWGTGTALGHHLCLTDTIFYFYFLSAFLVCLGLRKNLSKKLSKICGDGVV